MPKRAGRRRVRAERKKKVNSNWINGLPPPDRSLYMRELKSRYWKDLSPADRKRLRQTMSDARSKYWAGMSAEERRRRAKKMRLGLLRHQALVRKLLLEAKRRDETTEATA